ncbi:MAG: SRPBCC family protein [Betaproteobacteria bacterium]|nr:SRPBCC family protein [Betaproteobacteria bacterium]
MASTDRRRTLFLALCLLLLVLPATGQTADISVQTTRHGDSFEVEAVAEIEADVADAWKVLTDYDRLAEFVPGMRESRVVSRDGSNVVVDQRGEASLLFFTFPMRVRLAIEEYPHDRIVSNAISGNFKELYGVYHLEARGARLRLRYEGKFTPDFGVPPLIGTLLVRSTVERRFSAMVREIEKTRRHDPAPAGK